MEVEATHTAEGWLADPYGRHELRFFDGHRWTPYVRDGEENGIDEPGDPPAEDVTAAARSGLLSERVLVVERFTDIGRRWSDRTVHRTDGTQAGMLRRATPDTAAPRAANRSLVVPDHTQNDVVELVDHQQAVLLTLIRPIAAPKSLVEVRDSKGRDAGRIVEQNPRSGETTYAFLGPSGQFVGDLQAENWVAWDLRIFDNRSRTVATITRDWDGLDLASFPRPDDYVVRLAQPLHEPLRTLVVACALSLEIAVRPDPRGA
jgi:Protein of unknown function (DUF2510)